MTVEALSGPLSVLIAVAACFIMIWPGYAVLHVAGHGVGRWRWAPFAGPAVTLALWTIALSGTVWAGFTLKQTALPVIIATLVLAPVGLGLAASGWKKATSNGEASDLWLKWFAAATIVIPLLIMPATFRFGLADFVNSTRPDSWSYLAVADYLLTVPRGLEGGLSALHQYAAHLMGTRNATSAILGFLSTGLGEARVSQAIVLFCLLLLFANTAGLVAFSSTTFRRGGGATVAYLVIVALGWPANIIFEGNFDQLLLLPLLPVVAALACRGGKGLSTAGAGILIGILIAAAFYAYVELAVLGLLVAMSFIATPAVRLQSIVWRAVVACCIALPIAVVLTWPAADSLLVMLKGQYSMTQGAARPGEGYFPGLVSHPSWLGALWALGPEFRLRHFTSLPNIVGAGLLLVAAAGAWFERKRWSAILAFAVVAIAYIYFAYWQQYDYAGYKIISVNFWLIGFFVVAGFTGLAEFLPESGKVQRWAAIAAAIGLLGLAGIRIEVAKKITEFKQNAMEQAKYREIQAAAKIIGQQPTLLAVRNAYANEWAVFYLADIPMLIAPYRLYMAQAHVVPLMLRAKAVDPGAIRYIVTDHNDVVRDRVAGARQVWQGQAYTLWAVERPDWVVLADVDSPNGLEGDASSYWAWLGGPSAQMIAVAGRGGQYELAAKFSPGPKAPPAPEGIHISVGGASGQRALAIRQATERIPINLSAGKTVITIKVDDQPVSGQPAGSDARPLVLRFADFTIKSLGSAN